MELRPLGRTGVQVSKLCLGTMMFGDRATDRRHHLLTPSGVSQRAPPRGGTPWLGLILVVVLGISIVASGVVATRLRLAPPVLLLGCGVLLGFVPAVREVHLPPEAVLLLFLPALLYWESLTTSPREIRRDLRGIMLMGTVLVVVTAGAVAIAGCAVTPARYTRRV